MRQEENYIMSTEETEEESAAPTTGAPAAEAAAAETEEAAAAVSNKSDARHSEHEAARLRASELEAEVATLRAALGAEKDTAADLAAELEELQASLHESHRALSAAHAAAEQAKHLAARHEAENAERGSAVGTLELQLKQAQDELRVQVEAVSTLEDEAAARGARKEELVALKRAAKKLGRQVTLLSGASSKRQNALENELHAVRKKCQTQRLELDEFTAQLRTEFAVDKAQSEARVTRLRRRYGRLRTLQFEDKQQMLRESQEVVRAMQSQFDEFRRYVGLSAVFYYFESSTNAKGNLKVLADRSHLPLPPLFPSHHHHHHHHHYHTTGTLLLASPSTSSASRRVNSRISFTPKCGHMRRSCATSRLVRTAISTAWSRPRTLRSCR